MNTHLGGYYTIVPSNEEDGSADDDPAMELYPKTHFPSVSSLRNVHEMSRRPVSGDTLLLNGDKYTIDEFLGFGSSSGLVVNYMYRMTLSGSHAVGLIIEHDIDYAMPSQPYQKGAHQPRKDSDLIAWRISRIRDSACLIQASQPTSC